MVIIKNFKMPENCWECEMYYDYIHCCINNKLYTAEREDGRHPDCPLIEIPMIGYAETCGDLKINKRMALEPKRGRWNWVDGVRCNICNHKLQTTGLPTYCPNCGAIMNMDGDSE